MARAAADLHTEELRDRIAWLIRLRWLAAVGVVITVWATPRLVGVPLAQLPLYLIAAALIAYNAVLWALARARVQIAGDSAIVRFALLQLSADLVFLTALLHFSGGIENPFIGYFVFHIVFASILLPRSGAYLEVGLAMALLLALALLEADGSLHHYHLFGVVAGENARDPRYLFAVLFVLGTTLGFTAFITTSITARLRHRERQVVDLSGAVQARAQELEAAYQSLRALERERSEYMHRVAHDLRTPLAASDQMLAVVSQGRTGPVPEPARALVERTRQRLRGLLDLARDLLLLSRAREATTNLAREPVDMGRLLSDRAGDFRRQADAAGVALELLAQPSLPHVFGSPEPLSELLDNLVSNAIKYTPAGGQVHVRLEAREDGLELCVSDTGIGIPKEEQGLVFDDFYRAANARTLTRDGTGLGLSIVKAITAAHAGRLALESEPGRGSTFCVWLPAPPEAAGELGGES